MVLSSVSYSLLILRPVSPKHLHPHPSACGQGMLTCFIQHRAWHLRAAYRPSLMACGSSVGPRHICSPQSTVLSVCLSLLSYFALIMSYLFGTLSHLFCEVRAICLSTKREQLILEWSLIASSLCLLALGA